MWIVTWVRQCICRRLAGTDATVAADPVTVHCCSPQEVLKNVTVCACGCGSEENMLQCGGEKQTHDSVVSGQRKELSMDSAFPQSNQVISGEKFTF
jgi:hypothetical protein